MDKIENVLICDDCVMYIANGEVPELPYRDNDTVDVDEFISQVEYTLSQYKSPSVGGEAGFSWKQCDCCHSSLGGNRHYLDNAGAK